MIITGGGLPAGTSVRSTTNFVLTEAATLNGTTAVTGLASTEGVAIGQAVGGEGIQTGTTVAGVGFQSVTLNLAATGTGTSTITFSGSTITMSANAPASGSFGLTIAGGTMAAPLWGAGDTDRNPLPSVPVGVAQFNGRAYYALGLDGVVFSDSGFACRVSNIPFVQALTTDDGLAVTAVAPLMLSSPLVTTGIVAALLAFEGVSKIQQITGDPETSNLAMNALPVATGTAAPLTITPCELGTAFISPEGLRVVQFNGTISDPIGDAGSGITLPFVYSAVPSRMCAAATAHTIRISTQNGAPPPPNVPPFMPAPQQEWWWDIRPQGVDRADEFPGVADPALGWRVGGEHLCHGADRRAGDAVGFGRGALSQLDLRRKRHAAFVDVSADAVAGHRRNGDERACRHGALGAIPELQQHQRRGFRH